MDSPTMRHLQYFAFLVTLGLFFCVLVTTGYYHLRHAMLNSNFWLPAIAVEPLLVDFGDVSIASDLRREVTVKNTGWGDLVLERVRPSCSSCIIVQSYTKEPIRSGKQGKIEFSLNISKRHGKFETSFAVISNVESQKAVVVNVTANVLTESQ